MRIEIRCPVCYEVCFSGRAEFFTNAISDFQCVCGNAILTTELKKQWAHDDPANVPVLRISWIIPEVTRP